MKTLSLCFLAGALFGAYAQPAVSQLPVAIRNLDDTISVISAPVIIDTTLTPGSIFSVDITVNDVHEMWGTNFTLWYNTNVLTALDIASYGPFSVSSATIDDVSGFADVWLITYVGDCVGLTVNGVIPLGRIYFMVDDTGTSALNLDDTIADVSDVYGWKIFAEYKDGFFDNTPGAKYGVPRMPEPSAQAEERWTYSYDGPGNSLDEATSMIFGTNGKTYTAGFSMGKKSGYDFTVVSLDAAGNEEWVYRYNGGANITDAALCLSQDASGNIYAAGYSNSDTFLDISSDLTVISLTPGGALRWIYKYNGTANGADFATSIAWGADGNLYLTGSSWGGSGLKSDIVVLSLDADGLERWVMRLDGPEHWNDEAHTIVYGGDGSVYVAGVSQGTNTRADPIILSIPCAGPPRNWLYRLTTPINCTDGLLSMIRGSDGNLYACGYRYTPTNGPHQGMVISLTTSGAERWKYFSPYTAAGEWHCAQSLCCGQDKNIYIAGHVGTWYWSNYRATVWSLDSLGNQRWIYNGPLESAGNAIAYGSNNNLYIAGYSHGSAKNDFTVISVDTSGAERWIFKKNGGGNNDDVAHSIIYGADGCIYAAGNIRGGSFDDFAVVSLWEDAVSVKEGNSLSVRHGDFDLQVSSPTGAVLSFSILSPVAGRVSLGIYNAAGQKIQSNRIDVRSGNSDHALALLGSLSAGFYFLQAGTAERTATRKFLFVK